MKEMEQWIEQFKQIWESRFNELDRVLTILKTKK